jgi:hypothetical protein
MIIATLVPFKKEKLRKMIEYPTIIDLIAKIRSL